MIFENFKWRARQPCMFFYFGEQEVQYKRWMDGDLDDESIPKPDPTYILSEEEMNDLTISWLTGPPGPVGPEGMMGPKGDPV